MFLAGVVLGEGPPSFNCIQNAFGSSAHVVFCAFDLLTLAGQPVVHEPLSKRLQMLVAIYKHSELADISLLFPAADPDSFLRSVREVHGEGVVAKGNDSPYEPCRRSGYWRKHRINTAQEFVVGGCTHGVEPFDAVLIGFYRELPKESKTAAPPAVRSSCARARVLRIRA